MATNAATLRRTNEEPGTRAKLNGLRTSAFKVRPVLDLIRGENVTRALEILTFCERGPAEPVQKLLNSAIANAVNNDEQAAEELFVSACFADEGPTMKRIKFVGHGRTGRIRKRTSSVTIVVARLPEDRLERLRSKQAESAPQTGRRGRRAAAGSRASRVAKSKGPAATDEAVTEVEETELIETPEESTPEIVEAETGEVTTDEAAENESAVAEAPAESEPAEQTEKDGEK